MDKAKLIERRDALVRNREQIVANVNMLQGMIEEANFWIRSIEAEEAAEDAADAADDAAMDAEYAAEYVKDDATEAPELEPYDHAEAADNPPAVEEEASGGTQS